MNKVYIKTDEKNRVVGINSDAFLKELSDWIEIDAGEGDKYHHAQGNYLEKPIFNLSIGAFQYKYEKKKIKERSQEEMEADKPAPQPSIEERLELMSQALDEIIFGEEV